MTDLSTLDAPAREAVAAIDAGDLQTLERLLAAHPRLVRDRLPCGDEYFRHPYLLWFVAGNPVRHERLPANVAAVASAIIAAARRQGAANVGEQVDYTLALVCSGRVPRESGVQLALIDLLLDEGARPDGALLPALAHREEAPALRLLERGARLTAVAAACLGRTSELDRLVRDAPSEERRTALVGAAFWGQVRALETLVAHGVSLDAFGPDGFHPHATALHQAVYSGSLAAVRVLVQAGARTDLEDHAYHGTALDWAEHLGQAEIASYLRRNTQG